MSDLCPACAGGHHDQHDLDRGDWAELTGSQCSCRGDCKPQWLLDLAMELRLAMEMRDDA